MTSKLTKTLSISVTPAELAELFCDLHSDEQAEFFSHVGRIAQAWPGSGFCQQAYAIVTDQRLDDLGRRVLEKLADHVAEARQ